MATKIQLRRGTAAEWAAANPILAGGEVGVELDTYKYKIGNGSDSWNSLPYSSVSPTTISEMIGEHANRIDNPHSVTKAQVGLANVDNTSDANKPISTATQAALDLKANSNSVYTKTESDATFEPKNADIQSHISSTANPHSVTKGQVGLGNVDNVSAAELRSRATHTGTQLSSTISDFNSAVDSVISAQKGQASGIAPLDSSGLISSTYLPSYVDDVLQYANLSALPITGESGKIYVTADNNKIYRWSGSAYIEISPSPGSTDAVPEGSVNLYYTSARVDSRIALQKGAANGLATLDASSKLPSAQHGSYSDGSHHATATTSVPGFMSASDKSKLDGVQAGATANSTDAFLLSRANHTGTQLSTTISDFIEAAQDAVGATLANTATVNLTYNDAGNSVSAAVNDGSITNAKIAVGLDAAKIDGGLVSNTEFNYLDGVSAPIQTQLDGKQATITGAATTILTSNLTANRAVVSDVNGKIAASPTTSTELGYVSGVTSALQTQLNSKEPTITAGTAAQYWRGDKTWQTLNTGAVTESANLYYTDARVATYLNTQKGAVNGIAPLDATGVIPVQYIPTSVDDVLEFAKLANFPITGTANTIYIARDTNRIYRYQGNQYVALVTTALATTTSDEVPEGVTNLYYTDARVGTYVTTQKGIANGLASLDAGAKLPITQAPTASAVSLSTSSANAEGTASSLARADHTHAVSITNSEATATASTTTTSATDGLVAGMTLTPAAGTYLAMFSTTASHSSTGATISFSLYAGGAQAAASVRTIIPRPTNATNQIAVATQGIVTVNGSQAVEVRWSTSASTATANQRTLTLIKLS